MPDPIQKAISLKVDSHPRLSEFNRLVYPVVSRRAGGISLGINLNPAKTCTYNCVYCQVDRTAEIKGLKVSLKQITEELEYWIKEINDPRGSFIDQSLKDISIAGDGEPTLCKLLPKILVELVQVRKRFKLDRCKLVLFTNGTNIDRTELQEVFPEFYENGGQIWFKLDFWDESSFHRINRSNIAYSKIIENLKAIGKKHPVIFQSCFFSWNNEPYAPNLYAPYIALVKQLQETGVRIEMIQVYTLARQPAEPSAKPWSNEDMDSIHELLSSKLDLNLSIIYSKSSKS
ncbi:MAG: radical SAM protein [Proteobacteria bacterium]|nr:radical SAM protein [Pseudomonadota bacterium]